MPWVLPLALVVVFSLGLAIRLYDLTDPPLDFHPTRQLRVAMIARGIYFRMSPAADPQLRETAIAFARSMGTFEPPILESLVASTYRLFDSELLWVSRIFTTLFWLVGGAALFDLARRMTSLSGGTVSVLYYLFLPFSVIASRSFQPDPGMVMGIILSIYAFYRWAQTRRWRWAITAGLFSGMTVLVKVVAAYLVAGLAVALVIYVLGVRKALKSPQVWTMAALMVAPPLIYYGFILQGRSSDYFLNWTVALAPMLLDPAFYVRWLIHLGDLMGLTVLFLALVGVLISGPTNRIVLLALWLAYGIYGMTLPYQITTHSYYNLQLVPIVALSLAPVAERLVAPLVAQKTVWQFIFGGLALAFLAFFIWSSVYQLDAQDFRDAPSRWERISSALPDDGKIIAVTQDYGYPLMYYGGQKVDLWPDNAERRLADLRGRGSQDVLQEFKQRIKGKRYFLVTDFEQFENQPALNEILHAQYPLYAQEDGYILYDLEHPLQANQ
jgi:hypothetical protein